MRNATTKVSLQFATSPSNLLVDNKNKRHVLNCAFMEGRFGLSCIVKKKIVRMPKSSDRNIRHVLILDFMEVYS